MNIEQINEKLKEINSNLYVQKYISGKGYKFEFLFSNGISLKCREVYKFKRRLKKYNGFEHFDKLYTGDIDGRKKIEKEYTSFTCSLAGKLCQTIHKEKINKNLNKKDGIPWNKGKKGYQVAWNKGLTKNTNESLKILSQNRMGSGNPCFGKKYSEDHKKVLSELVKKRILDGKFTPYVTNSWCHSRIRTKINNKIIHHRSSWESVFHILNPTLYYEKIRIKYISQDNKTRIYITDFVDDDKKIIYEIKPNSNRNDISVLIKEEAAMDWCKVNGYSYIYIDDSYFKKNYNKDVLKNQSKETTNKIIKGMKQFL
jgi:hypothetical protein